MEEGDLMADDPKRANAFSLEYLESVRERDEPPTALEGETAEPWEVREAGDLYGLFHSWESPEQGDQPTGAFHQRETALLFRLIWPALGRDRLFRLGDRQETEGYPVESAGQVVGFLESFNPDAAFGAHIGSHLLRSPYSLALLLWLSGPTVQKQTGRILASLVAGAGPGEAVIPPRPR
jgi:hypothetical protein